MRMRACYEEILEGKKRPCLAIFQRLIFSTHFHGLVQRHLDCWTLEKMIQMSGVQLRRSFSSLKCNFMYFCKFFFKCEYVYIFVLVRTLPETTFFTFNNIIYLFTTIGLLPGGSGYSTCKQNMKLVTTKFK